MTTHPATPAEWKHAADLFKTLGDPLYLDTVVLLLDGPRSPGEISAAHGLPAGLTSGVTSNRLIRLKLLGLVEEGPSRLRRRPYALTEEGRRIAGRLAGLIATMG